MTLFDNGERVAPRRLYGLTLSVPVHLSLLAIATHITAARPSTPAASQPEIQVTYVATAKAPAALRDHMLVEPDALIADIGGETALSLPEFNFDITKISVRRNILFPFLTVDLAFLDDIRREIARNNSRLVQAWSGGGRTGPQSKPALAMSAAVVEQTVDRAWARRDRWKKFEELAELIQRHDPDTGRAAELLHAYRDRDILQPICDYRIVTSPPRRETIIPDHMLWAMLENTSDHADFVDLAHAFALEHPATKSTTELLLIVDKLVQANRDALLKLLRTDAGRFLTVTQATNGSAFELITTLQRQYQRWLAARGLDSTAAIKARYDDVRMRLLSMVIDTSPNGYRAGDARFLAGEIAFDQEKTSEAVKWWNGIVPDLDDSYITTYTQLRRELQSAGSVDRQRIRRVLESRESNWRLFSSDRLHHFGFTCDTF